MIIKFDEFPIHSTRNVIWLHFPMTTHQVKKGDWGRGEDVEEEEEEEDWVALLWFG